MGTKTEVESLFDEAIRHEEHGEWDQAIANYTTAIRLDPKFAVAYYNRGWAYKENGKTKAEADFTKAKELKEVGKKVAH